MNTDKFGRERATDSDLKITDKERVNGQSSSVVREVPDEALLQEMDGLEAFTPPRHSDGLVGWTMFDTPSAQDDIPLSRCCRRTR